MHLTSVKCCAGIIRAIAIICLAWHTLSLIDNSETHATLYNFGPPKVHIHVVDKDGPIRVRDRFIPYGEGGLPSLNLFEKYLPTDDSMGFWSTVELEVSIRVDDHWGRGRHKFDDWFDWWCDHDDDWGMDDEWEEDEPEGPGSVYIGIDKFVKNKTGVDWDNFRIELGTGMRDQFVPSMYDDGLHFTTDPMNKEVTDNYNPNPSQTSDSIMWTADGDNYPGQEDGDKSIFWFGVHIPQEMFQLETGGGWGPWGHGAEYWKARFTIYQHVDIPTDPNETVPEPATAMLMLLGAVSCGLVRNRH